MALKIRKTGRRSTIDSVVTGQIFIWFNVGSQSINSESHYQSRSCCGRSLTPLRVCCDVCVCASGMLAPVLAEVLYEHVGPFAPLAVFGPTMVLTAIFAGESFDTQRAVLCCTVLCFRVALCRHILYLVHMPTVCAWCNSYHFSRVDYNLNRKLASPVNDATNSSSSSRVCEFRPFFG